MFFGAILTKRPIDYWLLPIVVEGAHNTRRPASGCAVAHGTGFVSPQFQFHRGPVSDRPSPEMTSRSFVARVGADRCFAAGNLAVAAIAVLAGVYAPPVFSPALAVPAV